MSDIIKYEIINPNTDKTQPYYKQGVLYIPTDEKYKYFIETRQFDEYGNASYYLIFGKEKFSVHCRPCRSDMYNRVKLTPKGEMRKYISELSKNNGNIVIEYVESGDNYDVFMIM